MNESQVDAFIARLWETYPPYRNITASRGREDADEILGAAVFATKPSSGVCGECCPFLSFAWMLYLSLGLLLSFFLYSHMLYTLYKVRGVLSCRVVVDLM